MNKPVVLFGNSDIAELALYYLTRDAGRSVVGFTVDGAYVREPTFEGLPVIAFEDVAQEFAPSDHDMLVALAYTEVNRLRARKCREATGKGYTLTSYVSSKATVFPGFDHGPNCFVLEDNTIQPFARIGANVTLWSGNHVGHHATIADDCFITSHVVISGRVSVGQGSFVGVNATLRDGISLGRECVIGAGCLLLEDAPDYAVYPGRGAERSPVPSHRLRRL